MMKMMKMLREQKGVVLVEYALVGALVGVALVVTLGLLAGGIGTTMNTIIAAL